MVGLVRDTVSVQDGLDLEWRDAPPLACIAMVKTRRALPKAQPLIAQDARLAKIHARRPAAHAALCVSASQMAQLAVGTVDLPTRRTVSGAPPPREEAVVAAVDVVAAVAATGARVVDRVAGVVVERGVVVGRARRRVRVAAVAGAGRAERRVAEEAAAVGVVVVGVVVVAGAGAAKQVSRGELVERQEHVIHDRVSDIADLCKG